MEATATVVVPCRWCGVIHELNPTVSGFIAWKDGVFIQDAMPELSAGQRELLISGTCDKCWDEMFGTSEEEE
jgi:hypothetical protein